MLLLKGVLLVAAIGTFLAALGRVAWNLYWLMDHRRRQALGEQNLTPPEPVYVRGPLFLGVVGIGLLLAGQSMTVVPAGMGGVRVSQLSGTRPGTLYPGGHLVNPLTDDIVLYDLREKTYSTEAVRAAAPAKPGAEIPESPHPENMTVQTREGLSVGLAVTVRYQFDAKRLSDIHSRLPQPVEREVVTPVIASAFRDLAPNYTVRDIYSVKREDIRRQAAENISKRLGEDGILVKEVLLRDIQIPAEYARGLETLLLKEQESDRMAVETEIKTKEVRIRELQAEADKAQQVKQAEGEAAVRVLQAKAESDAMQYTLPLKEKQIQQTKLEAEARKESTIKNAEAAAEAKVIDSKAELERRGMLAEAEAKRIRLTAAADAERMAGEAKVLRSNPLLINKIMAEKLSDKIQIMMVPADGKFFLSDMMRGAMNAQQLSTQGGEDEDDPPQQPQQPKRR